MRNNEDRLGVAHPSEPPPMIPTTENNPSDPAPSAPLQFVTPTEFVELPTKGRYYPKEHPLHNEEIIEIRYMTAKDEDILTSRALLKKGLAIDRFLQNVIVNKQVRVDDLYVGDKNAIVVASRINGYGREYATRVTCPVCASAGDYTFDLGEAKVNYAEEEGSKHEYIGSGQFVVTLPKLNVTVTIRLLTGADERKLLQIQERVRKKNLPEATLTTQLRMFIVAVNGDSDYQTINSLIQNLPASDSRYLRDVLQSVSPNVDLTQWYECQICGNEEEMEVPFTTDFFWPKR